MNLKSLSAFKKELQKTADLKGLMPIKNQLMKAGLRSAPGLKTVRNPIVKQRNMLGVK
jgi:hypothetical protein